jgi:hypothetical protein
MAAPVPNHHSFLPPSRLIAAQPRQTPYSYLPSGEARAVATATAAPPAPATVQTKAAPGIRSVPSAIGS